MQRAVHLTTFQARRAAPALWTGRPGIATSPNPNLQSSRKTAHALRENLFTRYLAQILALTGTFEAPNRYPAGIIDVFVNGKPVVRDGALTGIRSARVLRRGADH